jgi:FkbM family methyltransferase
MTMISYGQSGEDVRLRRIFPGDSGFYIDVGANDPAIDSVTKHFYDRGWSGINVEPIPALYERLRAERPRDVNLNVGLSDREGRLAFYESAEKPGWSTFSPELAEAYRGRGLVLRERVVPVSTLASLCERYAHHPIDFLKIDVEGLEAEVLAGADWGRWAPRVVLVEDAWPHRWEHLLLSAGYVLATADGTNRFYVREDQRSLIPALVEPPGPGDDYVLFRHVRAVQVLYQRTDDGQEFGPAALQVACWLHRAATRHPTVASACKRLLRLAG